MKPIIFISLFLFFSINLFAQQWSAMGNGMSRYVPAPYQKSRVIDISSFDGKLFASGAFKKADNKVVNSTAYWDGYAWNPMGIGVWYDNLPDSIGYGSKLLAYKGNLISCGIFEGAGGTEINDSQHFASNIAKWNGIDWFPLTPPPTLSGVNGTCSTIGKYNNNLYFGGLFGNAFDSSGNHACQGIARWNDTTFSSVGQFAGNFPPYGYFSALAFTEYNNKLIAGGFFTSINGSPYGSYSGIAAWNDTSWSALSTGFNDAVFALTVFNGELYAGGKFTATGDNLTTLNHIAKWDGAQWLQVGEGLNDTVTVLCVDSLNNKLIAGGKFTQTGLGQPAKHIAEWNGTNWQEIGGGTNDAVYALFAKDSNLYVGGNFTQAGTVAANCIARWGYSQVGVDEINKTENVIKIYPNPSNGNFTLQINQSKAAERACLVIYDVLGKEVYNMQNIVLTAGLNEINITTQQLPPGIYFCKLNASSIFYGSKISVE